MAEEEEGKAAVSTSYLLSTQGHYLSPLASSSHRGSGRVLVGLPSGVIYYPKVWKGQIFGTMV